MNDTAFSSRQAGLSELDPDRLRASSVLVAGAGNVGGPAAFELARAGIGRILIIDRGSVTPPNLSRGIFSEKDLDMPKATAAATMIASSVPNVDVSAVVADVRFEVPELLLSECDAVVIATDSWSSRWYINRWAHALPGSVKTIVSGGLVGLSWDLISSAPGGPCAQCPHGNNVSTTDDGGGCGIIGGGEVEQVDPSVSFTGAAVAAYAVMEVCATLGGSGPRFAGRMLSFDYERGEHNVTAIVPAPACTGHRRLIPGDDYVLVPDEGVTLAQLTRRAADALRVDERDLSLTAGFEILRSRTCLSCRARKEFMQPLMVARGAASLPCADCGGGEFDVDTGTGLEGPDKTLAQLGVRQGKAVMAHIRDESRYVIRR